MFNGIRIGDLKIPWNPQKMEITSFFKNVLLWKALLKYFSSRFIYLDLDFKRNSRSTVYKGPFQILDFKLSESNHLPHFGMNDSWLTKGKQKLTFTTFLCDHEEDFWNYKVFFLTVRSKTTDWITPRLQGDIYNASKWNDKIIY